MSDKYKIDSHKLMFHPCRVSEWMKAKDDWEDAKKIYPIYVEISPVGFCNHRCTFCAVDFMDYKNVKLEYNILKDRLTEMASLGIKSVMFAGEGEPVLYKELPEILDHCSNIGIDTSLTTNMVPFTERNTENFVKNCSWIKISINGGDKKTYSKIHRTDESDFDKVLKNMERSVKLKKDKGYNCTIGSQILLVSDNFKSVENLAKISKDIGLDYLVVKPYSQHPGSITQVYKDIDYAEYLNLSKKLEKYNTDKFNVVFRINTMEKLIADDTRYKKCGSVPFFWAYVTAEGDVFGCSAYLHDKKFNYGNITDNTFKEVWESKRRKKSYEYVRNELNIDECRINCRMDEINRYLWQLNHPDKHVNFI